MVRVVTGQEMSAIDKRAIEEYGLPSAALMERAGLEVARAVAGAGDRDLRDTRVHVVCGGGNNGGDGFVAARALWNWGAKVRIFLATEPGRLKGDSAAFFRTASRMGIPIAVVTDQDIKKLGFALKTADTVVDALIGTGIHGPLRPLHKGIIAAINDSGARVVSVDVPSGVSADTAEAPAGGVNADVTVTFGLPKIGHLFAPGREYCGTLHVVDIGFPRPLVESATNRIWVRGEEAVNMLKPRPNDGHKGTFGRVVVVAGTYGMAGAAALTARGALRSGAGLVVWAGPETLTPTIQALVPEATAIPLPEQGGSLAQDAVSLLFDKLKEGDVLAIGPGLGQGEAVQRLVRDTLARWTGPAVIDADGLNALAALGANVAEQVNRGKVRVMTPHPKEAARLLEADPGALPLAPLKRAGELAGRWHSTVLLKGSPTVTVVPGGPTYVNGSGNNALATGGTGDVLTGVIAGLLAQGYGPGEACGLGAYVHGRAGELCADELGLHGTISSDAAFHVAKAFAELERAVRATRR